VSGARAVGARHTVVMRIEWRMQRDKLLTAIVRTFTLQTDDRPLQQFLVAKVTA
jgi:hypothetical protein